MTSTPPLSNSSPTMKPTPPPHIDALGRFGIDCKDFNKSLQRYDRITHEDLKREDSENRRLLDAAWAQYVHDVQQALTTKGETIMETLLNYRRGEGNQQAQTLTNGEQQSCDANSRVTAKEFAQSLSDMCFLGEGYIFKGFRHLKCTFGEPLGRVVCQVALSSPSRIVRLLGLQAARMFSADKKFLESFLECKGAQWTGFCLDRENAQENEHAVGLLLRLLDLRSKEKLAWLPSFPQCFANRIASMVDPQDQLLTLPPSNRQRAVFAALQVVEHAPSQAAAADLVRILLSVCTSRGSTNEETSTIVRTILQMFDDPQRRGYLRDSDLAPLFAPFLTLKTKEGDDEAYYEGMHHAREALERVMCSWSGLFWIASEAAGIRSLVDILHLPGPIDRKMVLLHLFNGVLRKLAPHRGIAPQIPWQGPATLRKRAQTQFNAADYDVVDTDEVNSSIAEGFHLWMERDDDDEEDDVIPTTKSIGYFTGDAMCASLLLVLEHHGLPQALITIVKRSGSGGYTAEMAHEAAMLLQHLLVLMDSTLPAMTVTALHHAFNDAIANLHGEKNLLVGSLTTKLFQNLNLTSASQLNQQGYARIASGSSSTQGSLQMEDHMFQQSLKESHVEQHNEPNRWNFDVLLSLVQGPLRNPNRLRWVRDNTRFLTRVLGFYKPSVVKSFATLKREECTPTICGFGVAMIELLLSCRDGAEMLEKSEFTKALKSMLVEVVEERTAQQGAQPILTRERIGPGAPLVGLVFLRMLGCYTRNANGLVLLRKNEIFATIEQLFAKLNASFPVGVSSPSFSSASPSSSPAAPNVSMTSLSPSSAVLSSELLYEVGHQLLQQLYLGSVPNYGVCYEIRSAVRAAMENKLCNPLRLCSVLQLRKVLWRDLATSMEWGLQLLCAALSDNFFMVVEHSYRMLASICCSSVQALDYLISLKPTALVENPIMKENRKKWGTNALLFAIAGRPDGFEFLHATGWIEEELQSWHVTESAAYQEEVERLSQGKDDSLAVAAKVRHGRTDSDIISSRRGTVVGPHRSRGVSFAVSHSPLTFFPTHFLSELCRTPGGCELVARHSCWSEAVKMLIEQGVSSTDEGPHYSPVTFDATLNTFEGTITSTFPDVAATPAMQRPLPLKSRDPLDELAEEVEELTQMQNKKKQLAKRREVEDDDKGELISAARGYGRKVSERAIESTADLTALKKNILILCNVGSSNAGFELLMKATPTSPGCIVERLLDMAHFSNHLSVRGVAILGISVLCRSQAAAAMLQEKQFAVVHSKSAYVSSNGIPYSVAFSHPKCSSWMCVARPPHVRGHNPRNAYREGNSETRGIPKDIADHIVALPNPINRDAAKTKLAAVLKDNKEALLDPNVLRLIADVSGMYRLRSVERKFLVELMQRAMVN